jgi:hypothetical protein
MLYTPRAVIKALGGIKPTAEITTRSDEVVINWKRFKTLPANTYVEMTEALAALKPPKSAPVSLWKQRHYRSPKKRRAHKNGRAR